MRHLLRPAAVVAAGVLTATMLTTGLAAPAQAAPEDDGGQWLRSQLTDGLVHNDQFGFDDYGLTVDFGLAFDSIGKKPVLRNVRRALSENVDSYTTFESDIYSGAVAKLTRFAQVAGADPRSYGEVNLVRRINQRIGTQGPRTGRLQDKGADDFANTIGQAFAVPALARAGSRKADRAARFLLKQQCGEGYFRLNFSRPGKKNQRCDAARADAKGPDTDVTALAVMALRDLPLSDRTRTTRGAVADAVAWLRSTQERNGSFGGGIATEASNTNSTGLAAQALGEAGVCRPAKRAARWVQRLQVSGDVSGTPLEGESGAIAYDRAAMTAGEASGITPENRDQWRRATAQAAPGLAYVGGC